MAVHMVIAETVAAMKKALKRKAYESDSDDSIEHPNNRGHKLQKRARFAHRGQLAPPQGPETYKETLEYKDVHRDIISRNPPLLDEDGYLIDSEDDEERVEEAMAEAAKLDPWAGVQIDHILAPLTAVTDLPTHPTMSRPFTSRTLTDLADQSSHLMRKENKALWKVKHLMTMLSGDFTWAPCGQMHGPDDLALFSDDYVLRNTLHTAQTSTVAGELEDRSPSTLNGDVKSDNSNDQIGAANGAVESTPDQDNTDPDITMEDPEVNQTASRTARDGEDSSRTVDSTDGNQSPQNGASSDQAANKGPSNGGKGKARSALPNGKSKSADSTSATGPDAAKDQQQAVVLASETAAAVAEQERVQRNGNGGGALRRVATNESSLTSDSIEERFVHPFFLPPAGARPDRDAGLPEDEAENIRRMLALYVQKQEEVCRGAKKLHEGLLRADRLRSTVLAWSKAEAHRDLEDNEDWYDKEAWGLVEDLKKGQDEEEEDTGVSAKKTRNRR